MIIYKNYKTFFVLGAEINIFNEESLTISVAEINERIYYISSQGNDISSAIYAWQKTNNRELSDDEFRQVLIDNNLISMAV